MRKLLSLLCLSLALVSCQESVEQAISEPDSAPRIKDGVQVQKLYLTTMQTDEEVVFRSLRGLVTDGETLGAWFYNDPIVYGRPQDSFRQLGSLGQGPGEYHSIASVQMTSQGIYVLCDQNRVSFYQDGEFISYFRLHSPKRITYPMVIGLGSDRMMAFDDFLIIPVAKDPVIGQIATVYTGAGEPVATIQDPEFKLIHIEMNPYAQRTFWAADGDRLFALYPYLGWLLEVDTQFQIVRRFQLESPIIRDYLDDYFLEDREEAYLPRKIPLFWNFQIVDGKGYATTATSMHRVDLDSGKVDALYQMKVVDDPDVAESETLSLPFFAIQNNGAVIMGNSLRDKLYQTKLPGFPKTD